MPEVEDEHPLMGPGRGRLTGKVAIVTGADSGIGRATARLFGREGAKVVCVDIWESGKPRIDRLIRQEGSEAEFILGDVTKTADWERAVSAALHRFGGLDILHSNAGSSASGKIHEVGDEEWDQIIQLNFNGIRLAAKAVVPHFLRQGRGNIVITASTHGILGVHGSAVYCATKAGLVNLTRQMALDYGPSVRVNCVCPGPIQTPSWRGWPPQPRRLLGGKDPTSAERASHVRALHREGLPEEVAYAVLFLACDESSYITGHPLVIDGGQTIDVH